MIDSRVTRDISVIESWSKLFAIVLGVLYRLGFLVVSSYLSRYGVSSFSVLQLQYLIAGVWLLGPPIVYSFLVHASRRFDDRAAPVVLGEFNWRRMIISSSFTAIPAGIFSALLCAIPGVLGSLTWSIGLRFFGFYLAMLGCAQMLWQSWQADAEKETPIINRSHGAPFYLALLVMIVLGFTVWFSVRVYPLIPFSLGGGKPLTVVFIEGEKKMPDEIQKPDPNVKRSIPYKLLLSTDRFYVVVAPSPKERSIEISRDAVAGIVVLE